MFRLDNMYIGLKCLRYASDLSIGCKVNKMKGTAQLLCMSYNDPPSPLQPFISTSIQVQNVCVRMCFPKHSSSYRYTDTNGAIEAVFLFSTDVAKLCHTVFSTS